MRSAYMGERVLVHMVCMRAACACSNAVITRPGAPEAEERRGCWTGKGRKWGWTGAKGGAGGLTTTEIRKDDFQPDNSKGLAARGTWIEKEFFPLTL